MGASLTRVESSADRAISLPGCLGYSVLNFTQCVLFGSYVFFLITLLIAKPTIALSFFESTWLTYAIKIGALFLPLLFFWLLIFSNGQYSFNVSSRGKKALNIMILVIVSIVIGFSLVIDTIYLIDCVPTGAVGEPIAYALLTNSTTTTLTTGINVCPFISPFPYNPNITYPTPSFSQWFYLTFPFFITTPSYVSLESFVLTFGGYLTDQVDTNFISLYVILWLMAVSCLGTLALLAITSQEKGIISIAGSGERGSYSQIPTISYGVELLQNKPIYETNSSIYNN